MQMLFAGQMKSLQSILIEKPFLLHMPMSITMKLVMTGSSMGVSRSGTLIPMAWLAPQAMM